MLTEKQIRAESPWMARGYMLQEEVVALRECAKTALPTERLTIKANLAASSPSRDALFDGSNAHLLNDAGDSFDSDVTSMEP